MVCFTFPYMLSSGIFYLPIHAFVYELQVEMYLIVTSFVLRANIGPAQGVDNVTLPWLLYQQVYYTTA